MEKATNSGMSWFREMCGMWRDIILRREKVNIFIWIFFMATSPLIPACILGWFLAALIIEVIEA